MPRSMNRTITFVAPTYGDDDVDVDQEAVARSGDAVAGQILAVDGGRGCSRVRVKATNIVRDAEVRSGDATARNESLILLDPRLKTEELEIEVDQEADARQWRRHRRTADRRARRWWPVRRRDPRRAERRPGRRRPDG